MPKKPWSSATNKHKQYGEHFIWTALARIWTQDHPNETRKLHALDRGLKMDIFANFFSYSRDKKKNFQIWITLKLKVCPIAKWYIFWMLSKVRQLADNVNMDGNVYNGERKLPEILNNHEQWNRIWLAKQKPKQLQTNLQIAILIVT